MDKCFAGRPDDQVSRLQVFYYFIHQFSYLAEGLSKQVAPGNCSIFVLANEDGVGDSPR